MIMLHSSSCNHLMLHVQVVPLNYHHDDIKIVSAHLLDQQCSLMIDVTHDITCLIVGRNSLLMSHSTSQTAVLGCILSPPALYCHMACIGEGMRSKIM